jgi:hypothetical protein
MFPSPSFTASTHCAGSSAGAPRRLRLGMLGEHRCLVRLARFVLPAVFAAALALARDAKATNCVPGQQVQCACPGGASGIQVCSEDGTRLGACVCAVPVASAATELVPGAASGPSSAAMQTTGTVAGKPRGRALFLTGLVLSAVGAVSLMREASGMLRRARKIVTAATPHHVSRAASLSVSAECSQPWESPR